MYLDTNNFVKELPYTSYYKFNTVEKTIAVNTPYYLSFNILKKNVAETVRIFDLDYSDHTFVIQDCIEALFNEHKDVCAVYTKLDLMQTFSQVRRNKYFKVFIGKRQLIFEK